MRTILLLLSVAAVTLRAAETPDSVARLVSESDEKVLAESLTAALASDQPLVRATAARVVAVRNVSALVPALRAKLETETDPSAARELVRAIGLTGTAEDVAAVAQSLTRWPVAMDDALAAAAARKGGAAALDLYARTLRATRMRNHSEFFRLALWGNPKLAALAGSRILAVTDERGWRGLIGALSDSDIVLDPGVLSMSLDSNAEDIRSATLWYLVRGYPVDTRAIHATVQEKLAAPRTELSSNREDFARVLLGRMLGGEKKDDDRWLKFLAEDEADQLLGDDPARLQYLTDAEYAVRYNRCEVRSRDCYLPRQRASARQIRSQTVTPPAFTLPEVLPAGLADAIVSGAHCDGFWAGLADATTDPAGRVQSLDLSRVKGTPACRRAVETLVRMSLASNTSMLSPRTGSVILVHASRAPMCLDESLPGPEITSTFRTAANVQPPKVKKRVEPIFPERTRRAMGSGSNVRISMESVIAKEGCVRNIRLLEQSPYPELNGAAVVALSQWMFYPGTLDGTPVDVIFALQTEFKNR